MIAPADKLWLLPGSLFLSRFEQTLAEEWAKTGHTQNERALQRLDQPVEASGLTVATVAQLI